MWIRPHSRSPHPPALASWLLLALCATAVPGYAADPPGPASAAPDDAIRTFVDTLCQRLAAKDAPWLEEHVQHPLPGHVLASITDGVPWVASRLASVSDHLTALAICEPDAAVRWTATDAGDARLEARLEVDGQPHTLTLSRGPTGLRLIDVSFVLPDTARRVPTSAGPPPTFELAGHTVDAEGQAGRFIGRLLEDAIRRDPVCIAAHRARHTESASLHVFASKTDGAPVAVRVLGSTAVPATLAGCVQTQLEASLRGTFTPAAPPFAVRHFLMLAMPVPAAEVEPGVPTMRMKAAPAVKRVEPQP